MRLLIVDTTCHIVAHKKTSCQISASLLTKQYCLIFFMFSQGNHQKPHDNIFYRILLDRTMIILFKKIIKMGLLDKTDKPTISPMASQNLI
ncbi:MAG: hypothetical protein A2521_06120 [Deltaproteobacteria bacterium RIFOXYD12_FULL_57_12]|nr:MAG: hypothetical protein A2521_06120 [Deltaproteobacteria bacterium RIFOXYD12_FULL_57_12]